MTLCSYTHIKLVFLFCIRIYHMLVPVPVPVPTKSGTDLTLLRHSAHNKYLDSDRNYRILLIT